MAMACVHRAGRASERYGVKRYGQGGGGGQGTSVRSGRWLADRKQTCSTAGLWGQDQVGVWQGRAAGSWDLLGRRGRTRHKARQAHICSIAHSSGVGPSSPTPKPRTAAGRQKRTGEEAAHPHCKLGQQPCVRRGLRPADVSGRHVRITCNDGPGDGVVNQCVPCTCLPDVVCLRHTVVANNGGAGKRSLPPPALDTSTNAHSTTTKVRRTCTHAGAAVTARQQRPWLPQPG